MKVSITKDFHKKWIVEIKQGPQSFWLYSFGNETKHHCLWVAKMFRVALKAHDKELLSKTNEHRRKIERV